MKKLIFSVLALALAACSVVAPQPTPTPSPAPTPTPDYSSVQITLERTVCFGFCPIYKLTIHGNGLVEYDGDRNVTVSGHQTTQLTQAQVAELVAVPGVVIEPGIVGGDQQPRRRAGAGHDSWRGGCRGAGRGIAARLEDFEIFCWRVDSLGRFWRNLFSRGNCPAPVQWHQGKPPNRFLSKNESLPDLASA